MPDIKTQSPLRTATTNDNHGLILQVMEKLEGQDVVFQTALKEQAHSWQTEIKQIYVRLDALTTALSTKGQLSWGLVVGVVAIGLSFTTIMGGFGNHFVSSKINEMTPVIAAISQRVIEASTKDREDMEILVNHRIQSAERDAESRTDRVWMMKFIDPIINKQAIKLVEP